MQNLGPHLRLTESKSAFQIPQVFVCTFKFKKYWTQYHGGYTHARGWELNPTNIRGYYIHKVFFSLSYLFIYLFIYLFRLHWVFIAVRGLPLVAVSGLLIVEASLVAEHGL